MASFKWNNLASKNAGVTVAIIGLAKKGRVKQRRIFSETDGETTVTNVENINAYLVGSKNIFVSSRSNQVSNLPEMLSGDKMTDGDNTAAKAAAQEHIRYSMSLLENRI